MSKKKRAQEQLEAIQDQLKSINNQLESNRETMTEIAKAGIDYSFKIDKIRGISERYGRAYGIGMGICVGVLGNIFASFGVTGISRMEL